MTLTKRQIDILAYLLSRKDWVTSEQLSAHFDINRKTIQQEIKLITEALAGKGTIVSSKSKGYYLEKLTEEITTFIRGEMMKYGGRSSLGLKPSSLVLYFLFLKTHITMQTLADTFYMSKTAISLELSTVKRWVDRWESIELEVSNKSGIKVHATEIDKRLYCSRFANVGVFRSMPLDNEVADTYEVYLQLAAEILAKAVTAHQYYITGEEYEKLCRFIASSLLRSRMGYLRQPEIAAGDMNQVEYNPETLNSRTINPLTKMITALIKERIGYELELLEQADIQAVLEECCVLDTEQFYIIGGKPPSSVFGGNGDSHQETETRLEQYEQQVCELLALPGMQIFTGYEREQMIEHIDRMELRNQSGNIALNHYNEDIVRQYPLEVHLNYRLFPECFRIRLSKEISFVALFLATALKRHRCSLSILLISNQNRSVIHQIERVLREYPACHHSDIQVLPMYLFKGNPEIRNRYDILLTTEQEPLFIDSSFHLIDCILPEQKIGELYELIQRRLDGIRTRKYRLIRQTYFCHTDLTGKDQRLGLDEIIDGCQDKSISYHTLGNQNLYIGRISPDVDTGIDLYTLDYSIPFLNKKIRRILYVKFHQGDDGILDFFRTVSDIIREVF